MKPEYYDDAIGELQGEINDLKHQRAHDRECIATFFEEAMTLEGVAELVEQIVSLEKAKGYTGSTETRWRGFGYAINDDGGEPLHYVLMRCDECWDHARMEGMSPNRDVSEYLPLAEDVVEGTCEELGIDYDALERHVIIADIWRTDISALPPHIAVARLLDLLHAYW